MKKCWVAGPVLGFLAAGPAMAADLPAPAPTYYKAPALVPAPVYSWTGFYLGAGGGNAVWNTDVQTAGALAGSSTQGGRGWLGTGVTGYDYQSGPFVVGILADFEYGDISGNFTDPTAGPNGATGTMAETSSWAVGGRVGFLPVPELLTYVSGGFTQAHFSSVDIGTAGGTFTLPSHTYNGWFLGLGLETTFPFLGNGWYLRNDYRYSQYQSASLAETSPAGTVSAIQTIHPYVQTISTALIYKFGAQTGAGAANLNVLSALGNFFKPAAPGHNWTGFYLAGGGGYGVWNVDTSTQSTTGVGITGPGTQGGRGWFGTGNLGYDYQITGRLVVGAMADIDFGDMRGTYQDNNPAAPGPIAGTMTENWAWAGGVRGGWLLTPQILSYYDGGYTQARFSSVNLGGFATLPSHTYSGYFMGTGLEAALPFLGNGWFARVEYRYAQYGKVDLTETAGGVARDTVTMHPYVQTVRSALVYRF